MDLFSVLRLLPLFGGSESVFRRMARAKGTEAILDYLAEIRFAMIFVGSRFEPEFEPDGKKGPDLRISDIVDQRRLKSNDFVPP